MGRDNWKIIRDRISADISDGQLVPGVQLPSEAQLCQSFQAGRHSVRRAVAALAVDGKLRVEQGRGTFVQAAPLINYHIGRRTRFRQNLLEQGVSPAGEQLSDAVIPASPAVAEALGLIVGASVHRLLRRGLADGVPISIGLSYHCAQRFADLALRRATGESVSDIYRSHGIPDYFRKRTTLFARHPSSEEARLLMQHPDQPVMVLQKSDVDRTGQPIGYSEAIWAADRVQFSFDTLGEGDSAPESVADV